jgi:DMSO/TMAO reductase YedYZ heme-binding membrane subunit
MIYVLTVLPLVLYAYFFPKFIRKFEYYHYAFAAIISLAFILLEGENFFNTGFLGVSFYIIVMFTGVLTKSRLKRNLSQIRAQFAIIGFILVTGHAVPYLLYLLEEGLIFVHPSIPIGILSYMIFVPLFITSFMQIRKRMNFKKWKKIHNFAYIGYTLLFIHIILLANTRQLFYIILLISYVVLKLIAYFDKLFTNQAKIRTGSVN